MAPIVPTLAESLETLLTACHEGTLHAVLPTLRKTPAIKQALAPLGRSIEEVPDARHLMQRCLELPADEPIHQAAADLLTRGVVPGPVHVSVAPLPRPRGNVHTLLRSRLAPVVLAGEKGRVTRWSTETGELLSEVALPKKTATAIALAELADGTVRALTDAHEVLALAPGAAAFKKVAAFTVEGGKNRERFWAGSDDLRHHLILPKFYATDGANGPEYELHLYDVTAKKPTSLTIAGHPGEFVKLGPTTIGLPFWRDVGDQRIHEFAAIDLPTGKLGVTRLPGDVGQIHPGADGQTLLGTWEHAPGQYSWFRIALADGAHTMLGPDEVEPARKLPRELMPLYDGLSGDGITATNEGEIRDASGKSIAYYVGAPHVWYGVLHRNLLLRGPRPGWFVVTRGGPDSTVTVIAPYEPARASEAPAPAPVGPPPAWARAGAVLFYETADYDAADDYRYRVVKADDGLTLQIDRMSGDPDGDEPQRPESVVKKLRFTAAALSDGDDPVVVAQGSTDLDDDVAPVTDRLPPNVFGRAAFARLTAGEQTPFMHAWIGEPTTLHEPGAVEARPLEIDGKDVRVPVRVFTGDALTAVILDDPRWPLVLSYEMGDCHLRLTRLTLARAT